jgi:MtN3 and saliva related transmembrane protein
MAFNIDCVAAVGFLAGICTTISFIPQVIKIAKTKRTVDLSFDTYALLTVGVFFWAVYGLLLKQPTIILPNAIVLVLAGYILGMKRKYG